MERLPPNMECTIIGVTGNKAYNNDIYIGSTSDDPWNTRTKLVVVEPENGFKYIGTMIVTPGPPVPWSNMITRGMNIKGFAYTWSYVHPVAEPTYLEAEGVTFAEFGDLLLRSCANVHEAIELILSIPRAFHGNFLLADAEGNLALVEVSTQSVYVAVLTKDGYVVRTNHWISPIMAPKDGVPDEFTNSSTWVRYTRALELLEKVYIGRIHVEDLMQIFSDTKTYEEWGYGICAGINSKKGGTVSSEIMEPKRLIFWYAYGWPCGVKPLWPEQLHQNMSWGVYLPFYLPELPPGEYVTTDGQLTPLAIEYLKKHLDIKEPGSLS